MPTSKNYCSLLHIAKRSCKWQSGDITVHVALEDMEIQTIERK